MARTLNTLYVFADDDTGRERDVTSPKEQVGNL